MTPGAPTTPRNTQQPVSQASTGSSGVSPADNQTTGVTRLSSKSPQSPAYKQLQALVPLTEDLGRNLTCPICLDYMYNARQLQCGHLFCADCVVRMLRMPVVRCAMCKTKTGKRMVRPAPLPFGDLARSLRVLQAILKDMCVDEDGIRGNMAVIPTPDKPSDGFPSTVGALVQRMRNERETRRARQSDDTEERAETATARERSKNASAARRGTDAKQGVTRATPKRAPPEAVATDRNGPTDAVRAQAICMMCPTRDDGGTVSFGKLCEVATERRGDTAQWAHETCALFSQDVYEMDTKVQNVIQTLQRAAATACSRVDCGERHATISCANATCMRAYHYRCAVADGCALVVDGYRMYCAAHKSEAPDVREVDYEQSCGRLGESVVEMHEDVCYLCCTGGRLLMCDGCPRVTHVACVGLRAIPLGEWRCGVCSGTHQPGMAVPKHVVVPKRTRGEEGGGGACASATGKKARRSGERRVVLSHTGLDEAQRETLVGVAKARRAVLKDVVDDKVTHVVIGAERADEKATRTMKLCVAVARRLPIVVWGWVRDSCQLTQGWMPVEARYVHAVCRWGEARGVLHGLRFCFQCFGGERERRDALMALVRAGGGSIVQQGGGRGELKMDAALRFVRNEDGVKGKGRRDSKSRFEPPVGASVVGHTWILDQIAQR